MTTIARDLMSRNVHMTFRANMGEGRHGWLRLTPAYGVRLVRERMDALPEGSVVTDPFSGTGTTPLAATELGLYGQSVDVNPFLIWLGAVKTRNYTEATLIATLEAARDVSMAAAHHKSGADLWEPNLFKIEKWWDNNALHALKALRAEIDSFEGEIRDLLDIALCRALIKTSNAAFNHQSMSFKEAAAEDTLFDLDEVDLTLRTFVTELKAVVDSARYDLLGSATIHLGDSRNALDGLRKADLVLTSPPYVNRMSYIRELRPYMYWLRFLDRASDAGDLDWQAIGGTWGAATTKLNTWTPVTETPIDATIEAVCANMRKDGGKNGSLLANYVHKYFHDMWLHFQAITSHIKSGGKVSYIVGNSTFYGHEVPAHSWYAEMLKTIGYDSVCVDTIRKRNSNKALFEYDVTGIRP